MILNNSENETIQRSKNLPSKKVALNCTHWALNNMEGWKNGIVEKWKNGILDEKHINNPALFQHSNIPPKECPWHNKFISCIIKKNITTIKEGGFLIQIKLLL